MSITTTNAHAARVAAAYGNKLQLGRDATAGEIKNAVVAHIIETVKDYEKETTVQAAVATALSGMTTIDPT